MQLNNRSTALNSVFKVVKNKTKNKKLLVEMKQLTTECLHYYS